MIRRWNQVLDGGVAAGLVVGLSFPIAVTVAECSATGSITLAKAVQVHTQNPLIWVLDMFPLLLAMCGHFIQASPAGAATSREIKRLAMLLFALAVVPAALLLYSLGHQTQMEKLVRAESLAHSVALRAATGQDPRGDLSDLQELFPAQTASLARLQSRAAQEKSPAPARALSHSASALAERFASQRLLKAAAADLDMKVGILGLGLTFALTLAMLRRMRAADALILEQRAELLERAALLSQQKEKLKAVAQELQAANESLKQMAALVADSEDAIVMTDLNGIVREWNAAAERLFGYSSEEIIGKSSETIVPEGNIIENKEGLRAAASGKPPQEFETKRLCKDGRRVDVSITISTVTDDHGNIEAISQIIRDISEKREYDRRKEHEEREFRLAALHDGLTGIANLRAFQSRLQEDLETTDSVSLLFMDVDDFKQFNDTYGHLAGDEVLRTVARILTKHCRSVDFVARYGGEEFVVVLPETDDVNARYIAERFRRAIEEFDWSYRKVTVSVGVATGSKTSGRRLMEEADRALYWSKSAGKNRVTHVRELLAKA